MNGLTLAPHWTGFRAGTRRRCGNARTSSVLAAGGMGTPPSCADTHRAQPRWRLQRIAATFGNARTPSLLAASRIIPWLRRSHDHGNILPGTAERSENTSTPALLAASRITPSQWRRPDHGNVLSRIAMRGGNTGTLAPWPAQPRQHGWSGEENE